MKKKFVTGTLIAFVLFTFGYLAGKEAADRKYTRVINEMREVVMTAPKAANLKLRAYYFIGKKRCDSCINIQKYIEEVLKEKYGKLLENGTMIWQVVDIDEKQNEHYYKDFELKFRTVVLELMNDGEPGEFYRLDEVWDLEGDEAEFKKFIVENIDFCLGEEQ